MAITFAVCLSLGFLVCKLHECDGLPIGSFAYSVTPLNLEIRWMVKNKKSGQMDPDDSGCTGSLRTKRESLLLISLDVS